MDNDRFLIEENDLEQARSVCKYIKDSKLRNRCVANTLAALISKKYFTNYDVDVESGVHNISNVLEKFDISDIYINKTYIDVRFYFQENRILLPKKHIECNVVPAAYMLIKIDEQLSAAEVTGFLLPENLDLSNKEGDYYIVNESAVVSFYDVENRLIEEDSELPDDIELQSYKFLDNSHENEINFLKLLLVNAEARLILRNLANGQNLLRHIAIPSIKDFENTKSQDNVEEVLTAEPVLDSGFGLEQNLDLSENANEELIENDTDIEDISFESSENLEIFDEPLLSEESNLTLSQEDSDFSELSEFESMELSEETVELNEEVDDEDDFLGNIEEDNDVNIESAQFETVVLEDDSAFDYSTSITPSLNTIESENGDNISEDDKEFEEIIEQETLLLDEELEQELEQELGHTVSEDVSREELAFEVLSQEENDNNSEQEDDDVQVDEEVEQTLGEELLDETLNQDIQNTDIDTLFNSNEEENYEQTYRPKSNNKLPLLCSLALIAALGYWGVSHYVIKNNNNVAMPTSSNLVSSKGVHKSKKDTDIDSKPVAMPVETVENVKKDIASNEGVLTSLSVVEKNLDASINVSNLSVSWEVPSGYVNNNIAKKYFTRIGKIIQLNLKTELLLLTTQPLTNNISIELEYDSATGGFVFKKMLVSSGDAAVDKLIEQTVRNVLSVGLNTNLSVFKNVQGTPVLVIKL